MNTRTLRGAALATAAVLLTGLALTAVLPAPAHAVTESRMKCYHTTDRDATDWGAYGVHATVKQVGRLCYGGRRMHYSRYIADATVLRMRIIGQGQCAFSTLTHGWLRFLDWGELFMGNRESGDVVHLPTASVRSKCYDAAAHNNASIHILRWKARAPMYMRSVRFDDHAVVWWMGVTPRCLHYREDTCGPNDRLAHRNLQGRLGPNDV